MKTLFRIVDHGNKFLVISNRSIQILEGTGTFLRDMEGKKKIFVSKDACEINLIMNNKEKFLLIVHKNKVAIYKQ